MGIPETYDSDTGLKYHEYYLYSEKAWDVVPSGVVSFDLTYPVYQNAPVVVTPSGHEVTTPYDPWAKVSGSEKYQKVGYGYFDTLDTGEYNPDVKEFSLYPLSSGTIVFNGPTTEKVFVEYEAGPSGYYIMKSIDYNPVRNEVDSGFLHFSQTTAPASIALSASRSSMRADGRQGCKLTAIVYDVDYDRVPGSPVLFEIKNLSQGLTPVSGVYSGYWSELGEITPYLGTETGTDASGVGIQVLESTNVRGEAYVDYLTHLGKTGIPIIKAYYQTASGVYDEVGFYQFYLQSDPFTLDLSQLDTMDYLE